MNKREKRKEENFKTDKNEYKSQKQDTDNKKNMKNRVNLEEKRNPQLKNLILK